LARRLGKPPSFINRNEQPERQLDVLEFVAIAKALNIEPVDLVRTAVGSLPKKSDLLRRGSFRQHCGHLSGTMAALGTAIYSQICSTGSAKF
jgi:transcriptional regulator with XRE-family HTH domain